MNIAQLHGLSTPTFSPKEQLKSVIEQVKDRFDQHMSEPRKFHAADTETRSNYLRSWYFPDISQEEMIRILGSLS